MNKCTRCGEMNPAEIHTCSPQSKATWLVKRLRDRQQTCSLALREKAAHELMRLDALNAELVEALDRLVRRDDADGVAYTGDHPIAQAKAALAKAKEQT